MPANKLALIRYKTIDNCLRNRTKKWTLQLLLEACSDALYEFEGIDKGVSLRTLQADIQLMRSDKLGYNAPIIVVDKKYYTYEDAKYSITNIPLSKQDLELLNDVKSTLQQFKGFSHFQEITDILNRLEDKIYVGRTKQPAIIQFETNERLTGLEHLESIHRAIMDKKALRLTYQSFKAREASDMIFHAYLLKEFRNRWFVLGKKTADSPIMTLALDRIKEVTIEELIPYIENRFINVQTYFNDIIGVTKSEGHEAEEVVFKIAQSQTPYVVTKPFHNSQEIVGILENGDMIFKIKVQLNLELERDFLGFGEYIEVLSPRRLRGRMKKRLSGSVNIYKD